MSDAQGRTLAQMLGDVERLREVIDQWPEGQRNTATALESAIDELQGEAFRRLLKGLVAQPSFSECLRELAGDEVIYAVLRHHGLLKASVQERLEMALQQVRPYLQSHGGDIQLMGLEVPESVTVQLIGTCEDCPAQDITLRESVEKAIREHCPEIQTIHSLSISEYGA